MRQVRRKTPHHIDARVVQHDNIDKLGNVRIKEDSFRDHQRDSTDSMCHP